MPTFFKSFLTEEESNLLIECCECETVHRKGNRIEIKKSLGVFEFVCPQCKHASYYNLEEENKSLKDFMNQIPVHEQAQGGDVIYIKSDIEEAVFSLLRQRSSLE